VLVGDGFVMMLLCWSPGASSPIHAHSDKISGVQSNCFMLVLEGELTETVYGADVVDGDCVRSFGCSRSLTGGSTAYINDDIGVHKVANKTDQRALSLHVYAPGWDTVSLFVETPTDADGAPFDVDWADF